MQWYESRVYSGRQPPTANVRIRRKQMPSQYSDYLAHYGIFGMKWGIRRFQNEDGTLTEEGKMRYSKPESETWQKKDADRLSDTELNRRVSRLQRERQYKDLTTSEVERERKQFRKDLIKKALIVPVLGIAAILGKHYISANADKLPHLAMKFGKTLVSKMKISKFSKGLLTSNSQKYVKEAVKRAAKKTYNYRPRINNSLPRARKWPSIPIN